MFKMSRKALAQALPGPGNNAFIDAANDMGNRSACAEAIAMAFATVRSWGRAKTHIRVFFEAAANAWKPSPANSGTTGRRYNPTFGFLAPEPR